MEQENPEVPGFEENDDVELSEFQEKILALLSAEPNGIGIEDLYKNLVLTFTETQKTDMGPALMELQNRNLIEGFRQYSSDGIQIAFRLIRYPKASLWARLRCLFKHDIPADLAYETADMGLYRGGYCRRCRKLISLEPLGDAWADVIKKPWGEECVGHDISVATNRGLKVFQFP